MGARRWGLRRILFVCAFAGYGLGAARAKANGEMLRRQAVAAEFGRPKRCDAHAVVVSTPVVREGKSAFVAELSQLHCGSDAFAGPFRVQLYGGHPAIKRGEHWDVHASLAPVRLFLNPYVTDPRPSAARRGVSLSGAVVVAERLKPSHSAWRWLDHARISARKGIQRDYPARSEQLARALVLGEVDLPKQELEAFHTSGLSHLLAVSGSHLVVAVFGLARLLRWLFSRIPPLAARSDAGAWSSLIALPCCWLYGAFAGGSGSAWRAAWMMSFLLLCRGLGWPGRSKRALPLSMIGFALWDPLLAYDLSFALSAAATFGLLYVNPWLLSGARRLGSWTEGKLAPAVEAICASVAASAVCAPLLLAMGGGIPIWGLFANVICVPIGELVALPLALAHGLLAPLFPTVSKGLAMVAGGSLWVLRWVALGTARLPLTQLCLPPLRPVQWAWLGLVFAYAQRLQLQGSLWPAPPGSMLRRWATVGLLGLGLSELAVRAGASPKGRLRLTFLDVGQGDSLWIDFPDGSRMLVDGGGFVGSPVDPGERVILPYARERRATSLSTAVLSHPHPDHFGGLASSLPKLSLSEFWHTGQGEAEHAGFAYPAMMAGLRKRGVPMPSLAELCAKPRWFGSVRVEVLAPCPRFTPLINPNDNSLVLRLAFGKHVVLLVGDAEREQEGELVARYGAGLKAELLKVGHHGSRTSSNGTFLAAVRPRWGVISTGIRNRFGHPHPHALQRLRHTGVKVLRTDKGGAVIWESDGERTAIHRPRAHPWWGQVW